ncbi:MAG: agmatine deiminase family protein [Bacteroidales bacterium]|nr:agmatine deiminase family protein [Bacteroidales bacterium]
MRMPAEWEPQAFVQIVWPHAETDWAPYLKAAWECYGNIAREIARREPLAIITPEPAAVRDYLKALANVNLENIRFVEVEINDTWARDHAFITLMADDGRKQLTDFTFNGWGLKFAANLDNQINRKTFPTLKTMLADGADYRNELGIVLEGGSIESDGRGTILTTTSCLLADNRNNYADKAEAEASLLPRLHADRMLWLDHSWLAGDDTDGHIDTVARLCPDDTIAYVQCTDMADEHYAELHAMEVELQQLRTRDGKPYRLLPLPMADAVYERDFADAVEEERDQRLPATYANFLIINGAVLMPTYGQGEKDALAKTQLQKAFPDHEIVGIDCRVLIRQHGSLHCVTMQYFK